MSESDSLKIFSNLQSFLEISQENYLLSVSYLEKHRTPKEGGGYILSPDPEKRSFKYALISTAFSGFYIDLYIRLFYIVTNRRPPDNRWDWQTNEVKLESLGVTDVVLLDIVKRFRLMRNDIAHEKPYVFDKNFQNNLTGTAQDSAKVGQEIINRLNDAIPLRR